MRTNITHIVNRFKTLSIYFIINSTRKTRILRSRMTSPPPSFHHSAQTSHTPHLPTFFAMETISSEPGQLCL